MIVDLAGGRSARVMIEMRTKSRRSGCDSQQRGTRANQISVAAEEVEGHVLRNVIYDSSLGTGRLPEGSEA